MKTCKEGKQLRLGEAALFQQNENEVQPQFPQIKTDVAKLSESFQTFLFKNTYLFMALSN